MKTNGRLHSVVLVLTALSLFLILVSSTASAAAHASFSSRTLGPGYKVVILTDHSTVDPGDPYPIIYWSWDFGDGHTSSERNPVHIYANFGRYPLTLTVTQSNNYQSQATSMQLFGTDLVLGPARPNLPGF